MKYAPFYCEENIWHLCQEPQFAALERQVVFFFNAAQCCYLWEQRAAPPGKPVGWDYHVVLRYQDDDKAWWAWDLDSRLSMPAPWDEYLAATCGPTWQMLDELASRGEDVDQFRPVMRVVSADDYVAHFASDRSHMRDEQGNWLQPPPPWPAIGKGHNLPDYLETRRVSEG